MVLIGCRSSVGRGAYVCQRQVVRRNREMSEQLPDAAHPHMAAGAAVAGQTPAAQAPLAVGDLFAEGAAGGGLSEAARENEDQGEEVDGKDQLEQVKEDQHNLRRQLVWHVLQQGQDTIFNLICWLLEQDEDMHDKQSQDVRHSAAVSAIVSAMEDGLLVDVEECDASSAIEDIEAWHNKVLIARAQAYDEDHEGEEGYDVPARASASGSSGASSGSGGGVPSPAAARKPGEYDGVVQWQRQEGSASSGTGASASAPAATAPEKAPGGKTPPPSLSSSPSSSSVPARPDGSGAAATAQPFEDYRSPTRQHLAS